MRSPFLCVILLLVPVCLWAQLEITPQASVLSHEADIYNLEINNPTGNPYVVFFDIEVRKDNQLLYQATTNQYALVSPLAIVNQSQLQPIQVTRNDLFDFSGQFQLQIQVRDQNTREVLFVDRYLIDGAKDNISPKGSKSPGIDFSYSGQANIYGQLSSMQGIGSAVPQNYVRAEIHPDIQVGGIPFGLDILLSSEQNAFRQSMKQVALRFDAQQFKRSMQRRLQSKIKEIDAIGNLADVQNLDQLKEKTLAKRFPKLREWEAQINDPEIQNGLQQIKQLESLDQVIESPEVKEAIASKVKLEAKSTLSQSENEELKRLQSFSLEIEKLNSKANQIRSASQKYEQYKELSKKITQAKKYANNDIVKDPVFLKDGMKSLNLMTKPQEILSGFDAITIGTSYPFYSRQTLSSLNVNGINVEWNPGKVYLATTVGQSARFTINESFVNEPLTLPQTTLAVKAGYGSPHSSHFHLTYINIADQFDAQYVDNSTKPQSNKIVGACSQLSLFSDRITVGGELNASILTRDNTIETEDIQEFQREDIPLNSLFGNVNNSSSFDIAWRAYTDLKVFGNATKIKASVERIGANYYSLGSPVLLNDMLRWKTELRQSFFKNKLSLSAFARQDANNLDPLLTSSATTTKSYGISGAANISRWPSLTFSFAPYSQNSEIVSTNEEFITDATMLNLGLGYPIQVSKQLSSYTQLTYLSQDLNSNISEIDYNLKMYGINQSLTYNRSSLNLAINYTPNQVINQENQEVITFNGSISTQLFKKLNTSLGLQYLAITNTQSRTGFFVNALYPVASFADFEIRVQRNIYSAQNEVDDFNDTIAWGGLKIRW